MKIAIVGAHRRTRLDAPFASPGWDVWAVSPRNWRDLPGHDVWFELHPLEVLDRFSDDYRAWLRNLPCVYMQDAFPGFRGAVRFPQDALVERFGAAFFTSSIAWMLAKAIDEAPEAIGIWGVECSHAGEYGPQRWGIQHFIGVARALGIDVVLPEGCALARPTPLYGYEHDRYARPD